jgi:hypothetical protein
MMQVNNNALQAFIYDASILNQKKELNNSNPQEVQRVENKDQIKNNTQDNENSLKNSIEEQKINQVIQQLKRIEQKVIAHELAHKSVGGDLAGPINYKYKTGPDGKRYIVGGEVPIKIKKGKTPEETIEIAQRIKAAALAPADPSPQDLRVASRATAMEMQARAELYKKQLNSEDKNDESYKIDITV